MIMPYALFGFVWSVEFPLTWNPLVKIDHKKLCGPEYYLELIHCF